jgi:arginyl-tRNA synthetase
LIPPYDSGSTIFTIDYLMKTVKDQLEEKISAAMQAYAPGAGICPAIVQPSTNPQFGDYQVNGVMPLAKTIKANPVQSAQEIVLRMDVSKICERPEVAGPGFINLRLKSDFVAKSLLEVNKDPANLGIEKAAEPKTIVVDFSSPNIAKQMHVGHLRSTIIGDCICRILEFLGHKVIRQNHFGDWGTNFGMVILGLWHICMAKKIHNNTQYYKTELKELKTHAKDKSSLESICLRIRNRHEEDWKNDSLKELGDGEKFFHPFLKEIKKRDENYIWEEILTAYQYVNLLEESASEIDDLIMTTRQKPKKVVYGRLSRHVTAMLQNEKDERNKQEFESWDFIRDITLKDDNKIYEMLGISFDEDTEIRGESFYKDMLPDVVAELKRKGLAKESEGAVCVFPLDSTGSPQAGFKDKEGKSLPVIIQKSDGAYLYATTDLAAIRYRVEKLKADRIIYVTDARQNLHFQMLFAVADMAGWLERNGKKIEPVHVTFGSVLGENGKPLKTREGENVKLKELLDEAVTRARKIVEEKNPELPDKQKDEIARAVGIGAVKYADYSNNRTSDYVFSFDKMLAMEGNTAPYMQYAYARIKSIERKAETKGVKIEDELADIKTLSLTEPAELNLGKHLIRYGEAVEAATSDYRPNYLTSYLYDLAQKFSAFYTDCPVLDAGPDKRPTRLLLCDLTARTIKHGLSTLLGIEVVEQM